MQSSMYVRDFIKFSVLKKWSCGLLGNYLPISEFLRYWNVHVLSYVV